MRFRKKRIDTFILKSRFEQHKIIKDNLIKLIKEAEGKNIVTKNDGYHNDNITKTDFCFADNLERPWVKELMKEFTAVFGNFCDEMSMLEMKLNKIWYQLYEKDSCHNWHTHAGNYSGVYYLNLPEGSAKTQFIDTNKLDVFEIDAKEGDVIFFPCYLIHRGAHQLIDKPKIIISWNLDFTKIKLQDLG
jgi:hypothetical protein